MTTNPNSPACASRIAASSGDALLHAEHADHGVQDDRLDDQQRDDRQQDQPIAFQTVRMSTVMPTVMKNRPSSRPLNGATSISTW